MDPESLVVNYLKDLVPNTAITLIIDYFTFHGLFDGTLDNVYGINDILVLPNQKIITYSMKQSSIQLWNAYNKTCERSFNLRDISSYILRYMVLLMDGRVLFVFFSKSIKIFDPVNWKVDIMEIKFEYKIDSVKIISKDMVYILIADYFNHILILKKWNIKSNTCESIQIQGIGNIRNRFFFYDHEKFIECLSTGTMHLSDLSPTGNKRMPLIGHENAVYSCLVLPNNNYLASGDTDGIIKIWNMNTNSCIKTLVGHSGLIYTLTIMQPSNRLLSGSHENENVIKIWNLDKMDKDTDDDICEKTYQNICVHRKIVTSTDGWMACNYFDNTIRFWI